jgi:hypothetical protein
VICWRRKRKRKRKRKQVEKGLEKKQKKVVQRLRTKKTMHTARKIKKVTKGAGPVGDRDKDKGGGVAAAKNKEDNRTVLDTDKEENRAVPDKDRAVPVFPEELFYFSQGLFQILDRLFQVRSWLFQIPVELFPMCLVQRTSTDKKEKENRTQIHNIERASPHLLNLGWPPAPLPPRPPRPHITRQKDKKPLVSTTLFL